MDYAGILKKKNRTGPLAFVDLNRFDQNAREMARAVEGTDLKIRIATKSIRVPELIRRALNSSPKYQGLMCFSVQEANFLANQGFDDLLIAYPSVSAEDLQALRELHLSGRQVSMVIDHPKHLEALEAVFKTTPNKFAVILELDLSISLGSVVVGVRRSPLKQTGHILDMLSRIRKSSCLKFKGLMAYEAHVAGVGDQNPFKPKMNLLMKPLRQTCARIIARKRKQILKDISAHLPEDFVFNGGGTGSLSFNREEAGVLTELTAGSGFFCPGLFDYYSNFKLQPAAFFALQVVRKPEPGWSTCLGGGYVASGEPGWDRVPAPYSETENLSLSSFEAAGEVQTPVKTEQEKEIGDAIVFRHAKAGELMERFNQIYFIEDGELTTSAKTYRGFGECYF